MRGATDWPAGKEGGSDEHSYIKKEKNVEK